MFSLENKKKSCDAISAIMKSSAHVFYSPYQRDWNVEIWEQSPDEDGEDDQNNFEETKWVTGWGQRSHLLMIGTCWLFFSPNLSLISPTMSSSLKVAVTMNAKHRHKLPKMRLHPMNFPPRSRLKQNKNFPTVSIARRFEVDWSR